jgi:hypothetical protein
MADRAKRRGRIKREQKPATSRSKTRRFGARRRVRFKIRKVLEKSGLGEDGLQTSRPRQAKKRSEHVDEQEKEIAHWNASGMSQRQRYCGCGGSDRNISTCGGPETSIALATLALPRASGIRSSGQTLTCRLFEFSQFLK